MISAPSEMQLFPASQSCFFSDTAVYTQPRIPIPVLLCLSLPPFRSVKPTNRHADVPQSENDQGVEGEPPNKLERH